MPFVLALLLGLIVVAAIPVLFLWVRPEVTRSAEGKVVAFLVLFITPALIIYGGASAHLERSKTTSFCLSCHAMKPYGTSLQVADNEYLAASHYLNNRVPRDHACYTCHTDYALFGGVRSKMRGLRHVLVNYSGSVPDTIRLYKPFNNRECLYCHLGSRSFEESGGHQGDDVSLADLKSGKTSCITSGCHDVVHDVHRLKGVELWHPASGAPATEATE
jgi:nitrate/TMAO reductase-like tetraheme cytochrome c subunit